MVEANEQRVTVDDQPVIVVRSARRRRTVSADLTGGVLRLRVPLRLSHSDVARHARAFRTRLAKRSTTAKGSDEQLFQRALELAQKYFDGEVSPTSVTWSAQQSMRWGSTTSTEGTIRISQRMQNMPSWVVDAVIVHELAHLVESSHGPAFQRLVARYPRTAEADAFLEGVSWARQHLPPQD